MKRKNGYSLLLAGCMSLVFCKGSAQGVFTWRAGLDSIKKDGFYRILLTPQLVAKCRVDLADLRIQGPGSRFVSYVLKDRWETPDAKQEWLEIPHPVMMQKDSSNKHSYITLQYPVAYEIDRLSFLIENPVFYKRAARVTAEQEERGEYPAIADITIDPRNNILTIPPIRTRRLRIDIANADNAPLVIKGITCYQAARYLVTYLRAASGYQLLTGNAAASAPEYDLKYFTDSLTAPPPTIVPGAIVQAAVANSPAALPAMKGGEMPPSNRPSLLLWGILLAILILLVYFSVRMVKAITQKEKNDRL